MAEIRGFIGSAQSQGWNHELTRQIQASGSAVMHYNRDLGLPPVSRDTTLQTTDPGRDFFDRYPMVWNSEVWEMPHSSNLLDALVKFSYRKQTGTKLILFIRRWTGPIWRINVDPRAAATVATVEEIQREYPFMIASGSTQMIASYDWYAPEALYSKVFKNVLAQLQSSWTRMMERQARHELKTSMPTAMMLVSKDMSNNDIDKLVLAGFGLMNRNPDTVWQTFVSTVVNWFHMIRQVLNVPEPDTPMIIVIPAGPIVRETMFPITMSQWEQSAFSRLPVNSLYTTLSIDSLRASRVIALRSTPGIDTVSMKIGGRDESLIAHIYQKLPDDQEQVDPWINKNIVAFYVNVRAGTTHVTIPSSRNGSTTYHIADMMANSGMWPPPPPPPSKHGSDTRIFWSACNPNNAYCNYDFDSWPFFRDHAHQGLYGTLLAGSPVVMDNQKAADYFGRVAIKLIEAGINTPAKFAEHVSRYDSNVGSQSEMSDAEHAAVMVFRMLGMQDKRFKQVLNYFNGAYHVDHAAADSFFDGKKSGSKTTKHNTFVDVGDEYDYENLQYSAMPLREIRRAFLLASAADRSGLAFQNSSNKSGSKRWMLPAFLHWRDITFGDNTSGGVSTFEEAETAASLLKSPATWIDMMHTDLTKRNFVAVTRPGLFTRPADGLEHTGPYAADDGSEGIHRGERDAEGVEVRRSAGRSVFLDRLLDAGRMDERIASIADRKLQAKVTRFFGKFADENGDGNVLLDSLFDGPSPEMTCLYLDALVRRHFTNEEIEQSVNLLRDWADTFVVNNAEVVDKLGVMGTPILCSLNTRFVKVLVQLHGSIDAVHEIVDRLSENDPQHKPALLTAASIKKLLFGDKDCSEEVVEKILDREYFDCVAKGDLTLGKWGMVLLLGMLPPTPGIFKMLQASVQGCWFDMVMVHYLEVTSFPAFYVPARCLTAVCSELQMRVKRAELYTEQEMVVGHMRFAMPNIDQLGLHIPDAWIRSCQSVGALTTASVFFGSDVSSKATGFVVVDDFESSPKSSVRTIHIGHDGGHISTLRTTSLGKEYRNATSIPGMPSLTGMLPLEAIVYGTENDPSGMFRITGCASSAFM